MYRFSHMFRLILLCALLVRIPLVVVIWQNTKSAEDRFDTRFINNSDSREYVTLAENLIKHHRYTLDSTEPFTPNFFRAPGYPVFLSVLYVLSGMTTSTLLILMSQLILSLLNVALVIGIGRELFSPQAGLIAGAIYAVAPITIVLIGQALTETLFTTLLLAAVYSLIRVRPNATTRYNLLMIIASALFFGLATNVRAIALYVIPLPLLVILIRNGLTKRSFQFGLVLLLGYLICLAPWTIRNYRVLNTLTFATVGDFNLLLYNAASVVSHRQGISLRDAKDMVGAEFDSRLDALLLENPQLPQREVYALMRQVALEYLLDNPIATIFYHGVDSIQVLRPGYSQMNLVLQDDPQAYATNVNTVHLPGIGDLSPVQVVLFAYLTLYCVLLYVLMAGGIVFIIWHRRLDLFIILVLLPYWFAFAPSVAGNSRFRVPLEGFMALLAAIAVTAIWRWKQSKYQPVAS